jgi:phosphopantetheinyl transferase (holo-ACP synthase)
VNARCVDGPCGDGPLWRTRSVVAARAGSRPSSLSSSELARAAAIGHPAARARFIAGRTLLRELLAESRPVLAEEGIELVVERSGRLRVVGHDDLQVSVSHTHGLVAAATWCRGPVGIDVEPLGRAGLPPGETWLTLAEQHRLAELAADERREWLLRRWVAKEAVLKAVPSRTVPRRCIEVASDGRHAVTVDEAGVPELANQALTLHWHVIADRHLVALAH